MTVLTFAVNSPSRYILKKINFLYFSVHLYDFFENERLIRGPQVEGQYSTDLFTDKAQRIVESHNSSQPLFLYLAYQSVHGPLQVC